MSAAPNYGLDWFEGAISRPDLVLLDFAAAVRPQEYPVCFPSWSHLELGTRERGSGLR